MRGRPAAFGLFPLRYSRSQKAAGLGAATFLQTAAPPLVASPSLPRLAPEEAPGAPATIHAASPFPPSAFLLRLRRGFLPGSLPDTLLLFGIVFFSQARWLGVSLVPKSCARERRDCGPDSLLRGIGKDKRREGKDGREREKGRGWGKRERERGRQRQ